MTLHRANRPKAWAAACLAAVVPALWGGDWAKADEGAEPEGPAVVASIPPVHSLTAMVMAGVGRPRLLLAKGASPHDYALKPSDARALSRAKLVVWVGPGLESFLGGPLKTLARRAAKLELLRVPGLNLRRVRSGGVWPAPGGAKGHGTGPGRGGQRGRVIDPHIWLDPINAITIARAIARALTRADPAHGGRYAANAGRIAVRLSALDRALAKRLGPVRPIPYIVFHDAYGYFEGRYGLNAVAAVAVAPGRRPGIRRIRAIRARLRQSRAACVFTEPQFAPAIAATINEGSGARLGVLDPLGTDLAPGPGLYPALMTGLADALISCLTPAAAR